MTMIILLTYFYHQISCQAHPHLRMNLGKTMRGHTFTQAWDSSTWPLCIHICSIVIITSSLLQMYLLCIALRIYGQRASIQTCDF